MKCLGLLDTLKYPAGDSDEERTVHFCFVLLNHNADVRDQRISDEEVNMLKEYPGFSITSSFEVLETKMWKFNLIYIYIFSGQRSHFRIIFSFDSYMYNTFQCCLKKVMLPPSEFLRTRLNT